MDQKEMILLLSFILLLSKVKNNQIQEYPNGHYISPNIEGVRLTLGVFKPFIRQ